MRRGDDGDFVPAGAAVGPLFARAASPDGPFARSVQEPTAIERVIGELVWKHQGRAAAISIAKLSGITGLDERGVKRTVEQLVVAHKLRIGGAREEPSGYYVVVKAADLAAATAPYKAQILAMLRRLRVLEEPRAVREFLGQLAMEE